jgi:hypothetical protein
MVDFHTMKFHHLSMDFHGKKSHVTRTAGRKAAWEDGGRIAKGEERIHHGDTENTKKEKFLRTCLKSCGEPAGQPEIQDVVCGRSAYGVTYPRNSDSE